MAEYYFYSTESEANNCIAYINGINELPLTMEINGVKSPESQKMIKWCESPLLITTGGYAVPRIPSSLLDYANIPQSTIDYFLANHGQDIREIANKDIVQIEE